MGNETKCEAIVTLKVRMLVPGQPNSIGANVGTYDFLNNLQYNDIIGEYSGPGENVELLQMDVCEGEMSLTASHE